MRHLRLLLLCAVLLPGDRPGGTHHGPPPLQWFKGNTHTHTFWSDCNDFPEMVVDWYRRHGYDFLVLSDHNVLSRGERWMETAVVAKRAPGAGALERCAERFGRDWVETRVRSGRRQVRLKTLAEVRALFARLGGGPLLIEGEEVSDSFQKKPVHLNALNLSEVIEPQGGESVRDTIRRNLQAVAAHARQTGRPVLAHLNHPNFGWAVTAEDLAHVVEERFFEVYNGHPAIHHRGDAVHASDERLWDIANTLRVARLGAPPLYGVATDDAHHYHGPKGATTGRGWIQVRARRCSPEELLGALRRGDFYASSGVTLDAVGYDRDAGRLRVAVQAEEGVRYTIRFIGTRRGADLGSRPAVGADGKPLDGVTRVYSDEVGTVLEEVEGVEATYRLSGDELYVRATVTSDAPHPNASFEGQVEEAWTQPVGFERHVR